jgi:hypothetical protein
VDTTLTINDLFEVDGSSLLELRTGSTWNGSDTYLLSSADRMRMGIMEVASLRNAIEAGTQVGYVPFNRVRYRSGGNLLVNPSFEAGGYQWNESSGANITAVFEASEVGPGLMATLTFEADGGYSYAQNVTIPTAWVGRPLTFTALVNVAGAGSVAPRVSGCGITATGTYNKASAAEGWQIITHTFVPQESGTLSVGLQLTSMTAADSEVSIDECALAFGVEAEPSGAKFGSLELGGRTEVLASAAPTGGTWKVGDIVWNSAPTAGGTVGWVCTTAGSPGTWKTFGTIAA